MWLKISVFFIGIFLMLCRSNDPSMLRLEGLVTVDGKPVKPVKAEIEINSSVKTGKFNSHLRADKVKGNFKTDLPINDDYEIVVKVERFPQQVLTLSTVQMDSTGVLNIYADFTSAEYDQKLEELIRATEEKLRLHNTRFNSHSFSSTYGNTTLDQLEYKVQIAAYKFYENFNYNNVLGFPKIIRQTDADHITRFTMGNYNTYNEALALLERVQKDKLKDAFIIAVYKGEKKMPLQLIEEKILK
jgi:hypothetical protein